MELPERKLADLIKGSEKAKWNPISNHNFKEFTEDEIKRITNNYGNCIGKGGFGEVYKGVLDDGTQVAVKKYICKDAQKLKEGFAKEINVHCKINHRNVVRLLGYCSEDNALMMVTEYVPGGNLGDLLHGSNAPISLDARLGIAVECADALGYMHSSMYQPVIHGDIKPDNILVHNNLSARLADFGISRLLSMDNTTHHTKNIIGSIGYLDPEQIETGLVDPKNDVYSFGVVLLELITRAKAAENGVTTGLIRNFTQALGKGKQKAREMFDTEIAADASNTKVLDKVGKLASECLRRDIKKRPEMRDVAEHLRMLRKSFRIEQGGQEKTGQRSLWNGQDKVVSRQEKTSISSSSSSISTVLFGIFSTNARRNFTRNAEPILEEIPSLKVFTHDDMMMMTDYYSLILGRESFGHVYKGTLLGNGAKVAVKSSVEVNQGIKNEFTHGVMIQNQMNHTNILKLIGCCLESNVPMLVYEFASRGGLRELLHCKYGRYPRLSLDLRLEIAIGTAEGLKYIHAYGDGQVICHGDVRPSNILLDDNWTPKISDFRCLNFLLDTNKNFDKFVARSKAYLDPVFMRTGLLTQKSDVYSFGVVLLELVTRKQSIYDGNRSLITEFGSVFAHERSGRAMFDKEIATEEDIPTLEMIGKLALECLKKKVKARPDMAEVTERLVMLRRKIDQEGTKQKALRR